MTSNSKTKIHKKIDTIYVYSKNNQVYLKNSENHFTSLNKMILNKEEWLLIKFRWDI